MYVYAVCHLIFYLNIEKNRDNDEKDVLYRVRDLYYTCTMISCLVSVCFSCLLGSALVISKHLPVPVDSQTGFLSCLFQPEEE